MKNSLQAEAAIHFHILLSPHRKFTWRTATTAFNQTSKSKRKKNKKKMLCLQFEPIPDASSGAASRSPQIFGLCSALFLLLSEAKQSWLKGELTLGAMTQTSVHTGAVEPERCHFQPAGSRFQPTTFTFSSAKTVPSS